MLSFHSNLSASPTRYPSLPHQQTPSTRSNPLPTPNATTNTYPNTPISINPSLATILFIHFEQISSESLTIVYKLDFTAMKAYATAHINTHTAKNRENVRRIGRMRCGMARRSSCVPVASLLRDSNRIKRRKNIPRSRWSTPTIVDVMVGRSLRR